MLKLFLSFSVGKKKNQAPPSKANKEFALGKHLVALSALVQGIVHFPVWECGVHTGSEATSSMGSGQIILLSQKEELIQEETASSDKDFKEKEN